MTPEAPVTLPDIEVWTAPAASASKTPTLMAIAPPDPTSDSEVASLSPTADTVTKPIEVNEPETVAVTSAFDSILASVPAPAPPKAVPNPTASVRDSTTFLPFAATLIDPDAVTEPVT